jgi:hypothetical protein
MTSSPTESRCWCGHLRRWHYFTNTCFWCARMEQRHPQFNFSPHHNFAEELPEHLRQQAAEAIERAIEEG